MQTVRKVLINAKLLHNIRVSEKSNWDEKNIFFLFRTIFVEKNADRQVVAIYAAKFWPCQVDFMKNPEDENPKLYPKNPSFVHGRQISKCIIVLRFQIWWYLDTFSPSFLFQKCILRFKNLGRMSLMDVSHYLFNHS